MFATPNKLANYNQSIQTPFKDLGNSPTKLEDKVWLRKRIEEEAYKAKQLKLLNSTLIHRLKDTTADWESAKRACSDSDLRVADLVRKVDMLEATVHDKDVDLVSASKELARQEQANRELLKHMKELEELRIEVIALRESKQQALVDMEGLCYEKDRETQRWREDLQNMRAAKEREMSALRDEVSALRHEQEAVKRELTSVENKKNEIALTLDRVFGELRTYREVGQKHEREAETFRTENSELKNKKESLLREIECLKQQIEALANELDMCRRRSTLVSRLKNMLGGIVALFQGMI